MVPELKVNPKAVLQASLPSGRRVEERTETELARGDDRLATLELWVGNLFIHEELVGRRNF